jgi:hypothetical protein
MHVRSDIGGPEKPVKILTQCIIMLFFRCLAVRPKTSGASLTMTSPAISSQKKCSINSIALLSPYNICKQEDMP